MNRPRPMGTGARREAEDAPLDVSRSHCESAAVVAATEAYAGRLISIGASQGSEGPGKVTLTGGSRFGDGAVGLEFRYRDGRPGSRRLDPSTSILVHRARPTDQ